MKAWTQPHLTENDTVVRLVHRAPVTDLMGALAGG